MWTLNIIYNVCILLKYILTYLLTYWHWTSQLELSLATKMNPLLAHTLHHIRRAAFFLEHPSSVNPKLFHCEICPITCTQEVAIVGEWAFNNLQYLS